MTTHIETTQFESAEVRQFAAQMAALFESFTSTAHRVRQLPQLQARRAIVDAGWPVEMMTAFDRFNAGALTRPELAAAVAKAILISQNELRP